ncbi:MAG TPA: flagellar hook-associated protein FlgL [Steroidobacteraceae bacterium]
MRVSTTTFHNDAVGQMDALQAAMARTQQDLSTGLRVRTAADDPTGMAQVNQMNVEISASTQYVTNSNTAQTNLQLESQALSDAADILQSANSLAIEANDSALTAAQRQNIATQLQQNLQSLVAIANRTDSNGSYLFGGYANGTVPFTQSGSTVSYNGASAVVQVQINENQSISAGDTGATAFMNIPSGNGTFVTAAGAGNTGTASISPGTVKDLSQWVPDTYTLSFTDPTDYQVTDSGGNVVTTGTYKDGDTISFNGAQVSVSGNPAAGDQFTIGGPAGTTSAFGALANLISTLNSTTLNNGQRATAIGNALQQINNSITNFSNVSASVGARLNAITTAQSAAQSNQATLKINVGAITNTDYAAATTQLSTEELALQAAQQSYASIAKLSLFQFLR